MSEFGIPTHQLEKRLHALEQHLVDVEAKIERQGSTISALLHAINQLPNITVYWDRGIDNWAVRVDD